MSLARCLNLYRPRSVTSALRVQQFPGSLNVWDPPVIPEVGTRPKLPRDQQFQSQNPYTLLRLRHIWCWVLTFPGKCQCYSKMSCKKGGEKYQSVTSVSKEGKGQQKQVSLNKSMSPGIRYRKGQKASSVWPKKREPGKGCFSQVRVQVLHQSGGVWSTEQLTATLQELWEVTAGRRHQGGEGPCSRWDSTAGRRLHVCA